MQEELKQEEKPNEKNKTTYESLLIFANLQILQLKDENESFKRSLASLKVEYKSERTASTLLRNQLQAEQTKYVPPNNPLRFTAVLSLLSLFFLLLFFFSVLPFGCFQNLLSYRSETRINKLEFENKQLTIEV